MTGTAIRAAPRVTPALLGLVALPVAIIIAAIALGAPPPAVAAALALAIALGVVARPLRRAGLASAWMVLLPFTILAGEVTAISLGGQSGRILWADLWVGLGLLVLLVRGRFVLDVPRAPLLVATLPFLAWCTLGLPLARDPLTAIAELKEWVVALAAGACAVRWVTTRMRARVLLGATVLTGVVLTVLMAHVALHDPRGFAIAVLTKNVDLPWGKSNYLAGLLLLGFPVALGLMGSAAGVREGAMWLAAAVVIALGLALSASKGAVLAVALACAAMFLGPWGRGSRAWPRVVMLVVFGLVAALFTTGPLRAALEYRMQASALDYSGSERMLLYRLAIDEGLRHPLLGIGINNFSVASHSLHGLDTVPHNLELGFFAELGVPGLALALAWCAALLGTAFGAVRASRTARDRTLALGVAAAVVAALLHNQVESTLYGEQFKLLLFGVAAAAWRLSLQDAPGVVAGCTGENPMPPGESCAMHETP